MCAQLTTEIYLLYNATVHVTKAADALVDDLALNLNNCRKTVFTGKVCSCSFGLSFSSLSYLEQLFFRIL